MTNFYFISYLCDFYKKECGSTTLLYILYNKVLFFCFPYSFLSTLATVNNLFSEYKVSCRSSNEE